MITSDRPFIWPHTSNSSFDYIILVGGNVWLHRYNVKLISTQNTKNEIPETLKSQHGGEHQEIQLLVTLETIYYTTAEYESKNHYD